MLLVLSASGCGSCDRTLVPRKVSCSLVRLSSSPEVNFGFSSLATYLTLFTLIGKLTQINCKPQRDVVFRK